MKTIKIFQELMTAVCLFVMGTTQVIADDKKGDDAPSVPIPLTSGSLLNGGEHRGVIFVPFTAYYQGGTIYISTSAELSVITIAVENETTGQTWDSTTDVSDGMGEICISDGDSGSYTVEIVTEYGDIYYGTFEIE